MKTLITVIAVIVLTSFSNKNNRTVENILDSSLKVYQISGYQGPKIDIKKDSLSQFLTALHYNIPLHEIENALNGAPKKQRKTSMPLLKINCSQKTEIAINQLLAYSHWNEEFCWKKKPKKWLMKLQTVFATGYPK
jgi:hypothetical protein